MDREFIKCLIEDLNNRTKDDVMIHNPFIHVMTIGFKFGEQWTFAGSICIKYDNSSLIFETYDHVEEFELMVPDSIDKLVECIDELAEESAEHYLFAQPSKTEGL